MIPAMPLTVEENGEPPKPWPADLPFTLGNLRSFDSVVDANGTVLRNRRGHR